MSEPTKKTKTYDVTDYGAVGDGVTDDTAAIQRAIDEANKDAEAEGAPPARSFSECRFVVVTPPGRSYYLASNHLNLHNKVGMENFYFKATLPNSNEQGEPK